MKVYKKRENGSILQKMDKQLNKEKDQNLDREWGAKIIRKEKVD